MISSLKLSSGHQMPIVGLGTWKSKPGQVANAVQVALEAGYKHVDCAAVYQNEPEVGTAFKDVFSAGKVKREDVFVTSKLWNTGHASSDVKPALQGSLSALGLEYLDLYLIHWPTSLKAGKELFPKDEEGKMIYADVPLMETWTAMEKCVDDGLVRSIGLSNFNSQQIQHILDKCRIKPAVLQVEVHPYLSQEKLVKFAQDKGLVVTAYSPFGSPDRPWAAPEEPVVLDDPKLKELGAKYNKSPAQIIMRWLVQRNIVVIPKSVTPSRIKQNLEFFDFELTKEDMGTVSGLNRDERMVVPMAVKDGKRVFRDGDAPHFPFLVDF